jgi:hypothetical protein
LTPPPHPTPTLPRTPLNIKGIIGEKERKTRSKKNKRKKK